MITLAFSQIRKLNFHKAENSTGAQRLLMPDSYYARFSEKEQAKRARENSCSFCLFRPEAEIG